MPSAPQKLRDKMKTRFGDEIDENGPIEYLEKKGFKLQKNWHWTLPAADYITTDDKGSA